MSFNNNKNSDSKMLIVVVIFMAVMFASNYFFDKPSEASNDAQETHSKVEDEDKSEKTSLIPEIFNENEEISEQKALEKNTRIFFENSKIKGSIDLDGGVIDSVFLKDFKQTTNSDSGNVQLLFPKNTANEAFFAISYLDKTNKESVTEKNVWRIDEDENSSSNSINIKTKTNNGLLIKRNIIIDDNYLVSVKDTIINATKQTIRLSAAANLIKSNPKNNNYAVVHEGLVGNIDGKIEEIKYSKVKNSQLSESPWFGYTDLYWLTSLINKNTNFGLEYGVSQNKDKETFKILISSKKDYKIYPETISSLDYSLFVGPKNIKLLKLYQENLNLDKFEMAIDFGWFFMITKPLVNLMDILQKIFVNMGIVVLVLTLFFKLLTYPLMKKSFLSTAKMKKLQPKVAVLQKTYAGDKLRINQELMSLYKKEGVSPMSGCLPMLIQAPIFFCLYKVFFISIEMRHAPLFGWISDLSAPDTAYLFNLFGLINWMPPSFLQIGIWPLIMGLTMVVQQKVSSATAKASVGTQKTSEQKMQENMMFMMPVLFTFICSSFPVSVVIYWTISNVITTWQQIYFNKKFGVKFK